MTPGIRPATVGDTEAIAQILSDWIDETSWMPRVHTRDEDRGFGAYLLEKTDVTVAQDGAQVVGFLALRQPFVQALYVAAHARRRGVGRRLLTHAKAGQNVLELWTFQANDPAREFYASHDFQEVRRTDGDGNDENLPDILFRWRRA